MKRFILLLTIIVGFTAVSCAPATADEESPNPVENNGGGLNSAPEANPDIFPRVTITPTPIGNTTSPGGTEGYPVLPTPTLSPAGYAVPTQPPPLNAYPEATGTLVWILKPVGEQCAETPATPDLQTAVADMVAFGIPVVASEVVELPVCTACGCPTSAHFRMQIDTGYLGNATALGWVAEQ